MTRAVVVTGIGLVTSVGDGAVQSCASLRAGLSRFTLLPLGLLPPYGSAARDQARGAPVRHRGTLVTSHLASRALDDLVASSRIGRADFAAAMPLIALPSLVGGDDCGVTQGLVRQTRWPAERLAIVGHGPPSMLRGMLRATHAIARGEVERAVLVGVEAWPDLEVLARLDGPGRLKSRRNTDGFIPGEAAAAVLLEAAGGEREALARVGAGGEGQGRRGLVQAMEAAASDGEVHWAVGNLNGESVRSRAWAEARVASAERWTNAVLDVPAQSWGDVGAASGGAFVAAAARAWARGYARADRCVVWSVAEDGDAAAVSLYRP